MYLLTDSEKSEYDNIEETFQERYQSFQESIVPASIHSCDDKNQFSDTGHENFFVPLHVIIPCPKLSNPNCGIRGATVLLNALSQVTFPQQCLKAPGN